MLRVLALFAAFLLLFSASGNAQLTTTVVVNGATVVQVIGTDAQGAPFTQAISTLAPAAPTQPGGPGAPGAPADPNNPANPVTTATPAPSPSKTQAAPITLNTDTAIQGPVGAPASTTGTPGAPIPYVYTTVVGGVTTVIQDIFTPTSPATVDVTPTGSGSILDFSDWLTMNGLSPTATTLPGGALALGPLFVGFIVPLVTTVWWLL